MLLVADSLLVESCVRRFCLLDASGLRGLARAGDVLTLQSEHKGSSGKIWIETGTVRQANGLSCVFSPPVIYTH